MTNKPSAFELHVPGKKARENACKRLVGERNGARFSANWNPLLTGSTWSILYSEDWVHNTNDSPLRYGHQVERQTSWLSSVLPLLKISFLFCFMMLSIWAVSVVASSCQIDALRKQLLSLLSMRLCKVIDWANVFFASSTSCSTLGSIYEKDKNTSRDQNKRFSHYWKYQHINPDKTAKQR